MEHEDIMLVSRHQNYIGNRTHFVNVKMLIYLILGEHVTVLFFPSVFVAFALHPAVIRLEE